MPETKCVVCGRKGRRVCPALGGLICASCCGSKRGSDITCPPDCSYFPFGTEAYDARLKIDASCANKVMEYVLDFFGRDYIEKVLQKIGHRGSLLEDNPGVALPAAINYLLGFKRGVNGKTIADIWEQEGWRGLSNDERVMMKYRRYSFPTIIEVQRIIDDKSMQCIDLFDPEESPFILFDRSMARSADRYTRFFMWITHYPNFSCPATGGYIVKRSISDDFYSELLRRIEEEQKENPDCTAKSYRAEHFSECCDLLGELERTCSDRLLNSLDIHHCEAVYEIAGTRSNIEEILEKKKDFEFDDRDPEPDDPEGSVYYVWLRRGESKELEASMPASFQFNDESQGVGTVGSLKITDTHLTLETFSHQKFEFAKEKIQAYFGDSVIFLHEKIEDLKDRLKEELNEARDRTSVKKQREPESALPPELEQKILEKHYLEHYTKFIDDSIPALDNMTPREAAEKPDMRPRLINLMKDHIQGISSMCRKRGISIDIDWVLKELGLHELF